MQKLLVLGRLLPTPPGNMRRHSKRALLPATLTHIMRSLCTQVRTYKMQPWHLPHFLAGHLCCWNKSVHGVLHTCPAGCLGKMTQHGRYVPKCMGIAPQQSRGHHVMGAPCHGPGQGAPCHALCLTQQGGA